MPLLAFVFPALFAGLTTFIVAPPSWLTLRPGQTALVADAAWPLGTRPEAALTGTAAGAATPTDEVVKRPVDALGAPIGIRVMIERVFPNGVALVRPQGTNVDAYARLDTLLPEIPSGTALVAAGDDGDTVDFYAARTTPYDDSLDLASGTPLLALKVAVAPFSPGESDFVRLQVRVEAGPFRGRTGWVQANSVGLPGRPEAGAPAKDKICGCRVVEFR
jgi:hypothetical protein